MWIIKLLICQNWTIQGVVGFCRHAPLRIESVMVLENSVIVTLRKDT